MNQMPTVAEQLIHYAKQHLGLTPARETEAPGLCFGLANAALLYASLGRTTEFLQTLNSISQYPQQSTLAKRTLVEACLYLQSLELQADLLQQSRPQQSLSAANLLTTANHKLQGHYFNTTASGFKQLLCRGAQPGLTGVIVKVPDVAHVIALLPTPDGWYLVDSEQAQSLLLTSEALTIWRRHTPVNANISLLLATTMLTATNQILHQLQQHTNSSWWPATPWKECFGKNADGKIHTCTECDKAFARSSSLTRHMRIHTGEKPYVCEKCGRGFAIKSTLKTHLRTHLGEKPFVCPECDKAFARSSSLTRHMRIHTGEKPYVCEKCGRGFKTKSNLKTHLRTHLGEKPFVCGKCKRRFGYKKSLNHHEKICKGNHPGSPTEATNTAANLPPPVAPLSPARHQPGCPAQYSVAACSCQASVAAAAAAAVGESDLTNVLTFNLDEENTALDALQGLFETTPPPSLPPQSKCILCQDRPVEPSNTEGLCNTCSILYV